MVANVNDNATRSPASVSCDDMFNDSTKDLKGFQKIFETYKEVSFNIAIKLVPSFKSQVTELQRRIYEQKKQCWAQERRSIDSEIMRLQSEIDRIYLNSEAEKLKKSVESIH
jgi:hypothetical protein